ncbi:TniQ family protein (plasmid) [Streptomyces sp. NBC_01707]|uniref:TniQ family protein n=1 Tax=Streptomyces sp. NBC_01707 TaxID=2975914 RepID=UPI002F90D1BA
MHPLPRSLEPMSGESLVSYLLRLGHRLSLPPLHLIRAAGWTERVYAHHLPGGLLLDLTGPQAEAFARLTRQTAEEVSALTLTQWRDRYPPIARSMPGSGHKRPDAWLFVGSPRFCPSCLAGDGTPAQQLHGGPWQKLWHLPVAFACVEHQTYLESDCPYCGQPHATSGRLIERANDHTLHPAQCRWTIDTQTQERTRACGGRLDQRAAPPPGGRPQPTADILRFQESLLARLKSPILATDAAEYFTDLRLATALISSTWPQGEHLLNTALAEHVTTHLHSDSERSDTSNGRLQYSRLRDAPPRDPVACAGLLHAAHSMLEAGDLSECLSRFIHAFSKRPTRTPWVRFFAGYEHSCSRRFRNAAEPLTHAFRKIGGPQGTRAPLRNDYRPEHIPAYLEPDWYERHFAPIVGIAPKVLRRTAAVRLVQWAIGGPLGDAAAYLGITPDRMQFRANTDYQRWERAGRDPAEFESVLRELSAELRTPCRPLVDYQRRREALRDWALPPDTWDALVSELPHIPGPIRPAVGDRKRQDASVFIWVQVTRGEHLFAPRPIEAEQPQHIQREWAQRRNITWHHLVRPNPLRHYADLRKLLTEYAYQLARDIDSSAGQISTVNGPTLTHSEHPWF